MKNIISILGDLGIEVPEDKQKDLEKSLNENYKTVNEYTALKEQKETLDAEIKKRDADLKELQAKVGTEGEAKAQLEEMTKKYEDLKNESEEKIKKQAYSFAVKEKVGQLHFTSKMAQKGFEQAVIDAGLKLEDGNLLGFDDFVKQTKESDAGIFAEEGQGQKPKWTSGNNNGGNAGKPMTKEDIMKITNTSKRQQAIAENIDLFK